MRTKRIKAVSAVAVALLCVAAVVEAPPVAHGHDDRVRVVLRLPGTLVQVGGHHRLVRRGPPARAGHGGPATAVLVFTFPQYWRHAQCSEVQIMQRLASMTDPDRQLRAGLDVGAAFVCNGTHARLDRWPNGETAMTLGGHWYWPNGERASAATGSWYYPDGTRARSPAGAWSYPSGAVARSRGGTWYAPGGERIAVDQGPRRQLVTVGVLERLWTAYGGRARSR